MASPVLLAYQVAPTPPTAPHPAHSGCGAGPEWLCGASCTWRTSNLLGRCQTPSHDVVFLGPSVGSAHPATRCAVESCNGADRAGTAAPPARFGLDSLDGRETGPALPPSPFRRRARSHAPVSLRYMDWVRRQSSKARQALANNRQGPRRPASTRLNQNVGVQLPAFLLAGLAREWRDDGMAGHVCFLLLVSCFSGPRHFYPDQARDILPGCGRLRHLLLPTLYRA